jgi:arylformamidase
MSSKYLSYFLKENTPTYGGIEGTIKFEKERSISSGDTSNNMRFELPGHVGTHIDFPYHFSDDGKKCGDYPASFWVFNKIGYLKCAINEIEKDIERLSSDIEILIVRTGFGKKRGFTEYWSSQPVIPSSLACIIKKKFPNIRVFGFDLISLTSKLDRIEGKNAHIEFLLKNEILILEDMYLENLETTPSTIIIAPLQIYDADGVPCNVISY